jgi:hypothetical protein
VVPNCCLQPGAACKTIVLHANNNSSTMQFSKLHTADKLAYVVPNCCLQPGAASTNQNNSYCCLGRLSM